MTVCAEVAPKFGARVLIVDWGVVDEFDSVGWQAPHLTLGGRSVLENADIGEDV